MLGTLFRSRCAGVLMLATFTLLYGQGHPGSVRGKVTDPSAATVPGATVILSNGKITRQAKTNASGSFEITDLPPGSYALRANAKGFADYETDGLQITAGVLDFDISLVITAEAASVTVSAESSHVSTDQSSSVGAIVLKQEDLKMLSDDPDDLASDLQALAGPSAGPNGGQIFIDGFSGGRLPPKESIREVRINSNPFSAEYDRMGFGRIEIFTKPGTDKFRGQAFLNFGDKIFNSRNPFVTGTVPDYQQQMFGGSMSGPLGKKASFFIDADRRSIDENAMIVANTLDPSYNIVNLNSALVTPLRRTTVSERIDYALNPNNTLVARYSWGQNRAENQGIGQFTLPSLATASSSTDNTVQVTETAVIGTHMINEARFQFFATRAGQTGLSNTPTIAVQGAFIGGGAPLSLNFTNENHYEFQDNVSVTHGTHQLRLGARIRGVDLATQSTSNYNGTFTFTGARVPLLTADNQIQLDGGQPVYTNLTSIELYRQTQLLLASGLTGAQVRALGYGPNQFAITGGQPLAGVGQVDAGLFAQDEWRVRPNITLSLGLRYEIQNNMRDHGDWAPRVGIAWAPGARKGAQAKTVVRAGFGIFYDRFNESLTLNAIRLNGITQQQFIIPNPDFYPSVPSIASLTAAQRPQAIREIASDLEAPRVAQTAVGFERQLPKSITVSMNYAFTRGTHQLLSRNINAPIPGTYDPSVPGSGVRPYGAAAGDLYLYESSGLFRQQQLITNVQARISPKFTLFGFYVLGKAESNADGAASFPANSYDLSSDWGRASFDVRHRAFVGGSITGPFRLQLNPFIVMSSAPPFNITTGRDTNGDGLFNDRPAFAADLSRPSVIHTAYGNLDLSPIAGEQIIPRNYGDAYGTFSVNLRLSRSWGFGERATPQGDTPRAGFGGPGGPGGGPRGGPGGPGGGPPPMMAGGGPGRGGPGGMFGGGGAGNKRFLLTLSVSARNAFNHVNLGAPVGDLSSRLFGQSIGIAGGFGSGGPGGAAGNRRIEFQLRLSF